MTLTRPEIEDEFDLSTAALKRCQSVGALLKQARQGFGRDVRQIGAALRIRASYLQAIEEGNYEELPGPAYAIGFIRTYAEYLGLDAEELVHCFKQETEGHDLKRDLSFPMPLSERSVSSRTMLLGAAILVVCGYGIWHYVSSDDHGRNERIAAVPSALLVPPSDTPLSAPPSSNRSALASAVTTPAASAPPPAPTTAALPPTPAAHSGAGVSQTVLLAQAQQTPSALPLGLPPPGPSTTVVSLPPSPAPAAQPPVDPGRVFGVTDSARYRIVLRATDDTWLEVKDGNTSIFRRLMHAGDEYRLADKPELTMRVGNTRGIEVTIDGKPLPSPVAADLFRHVVVNLDAKELLARAEAR